MILQTAPDQIEGWIPLASPYSAVRGATSRSTRVSRDSSSSHEVQMASEQATYTTARINMEATQLLLPLEEDARIAVEVVRRVRSAQVALRWPETGVRAVC